MIDVCLWACGAQVPRLWQRLLPVAYSCFAALLGAQSVLFSKALSLLLRTTIQGESQLGSWCVLLSGMYRLLPLVYGPTVNCKETCVRGESGGIRQMRCFLDHGFDRCKTRHHVCQFES